jgi:outer membrane protein OmpA-like peptidoglycan-associated protein
MNITLKPTLIALALGAAACATAAPPNALINARASYKAASQGPAAQHDPADLDTARKALERAERSFKDRGDTQATTDLAYAADRHAKIAEAQGSAKMYGQQEEETLASMRAKQASHARMTAAELSGAKQDLALQGQEIASERDRRIEAEKRLKQAAEDLAKFASIKQEKRGMVITLSGNVLFASAKSELFPGAALKLNSVVEMLTEQDPDSRVLVEGHTDSQGRADYNQQLSQRRAETVSAYLVGRGIAADRVTAQGFGSTRPIADNKSTEGRANNRRVEIVVTPATTALLN